MYDIWVNLTLLIYALLFCGFLWVVLYIFGTAFEDLLGGVFRKFRAKREREDDHYIY